MALFKILKGDSSRISICLSDDDARSTIRLSLGTDTNEVDIYYTAKVLYHEVCNLLRFTGGSTNGI